MPSRVAHVLRVFTRDGEGGNHLGLIDDVAGLDSTTMQEIAADLGFSETVFVDWPAGETPYVRIFTPGQELPFAGHPLVGTAWTLLTMGPGGISALRCGIGDVAVGSGEDAAWIEAGLQPENAELRDMSDYAIRADLPPPQRSWLVSMPKEYVILEYGDADVVATAAPDPAVMRERFGTMILARSGDHARVRFFAPDAGVFEDPATGSAAVALATALVVAGETEGALTIHQGEEMGFPSQIDLSWTPAVARIAGGCVHDETRLIDK